MTGDLSCRPTPFAGRSCQPDTLATVRDRTRQQFGYDRRTAHQRPETRALRRDHSGGCCTGSRRRVAFDARVGFAGTRVGSEHARDDDLRAPRHPRRRRCPTRCSRPAATPSCASSAACVCGSDLWPYRGVTPTHEPHRIGHEFVGVVEEVGDEVRHDQARRLRDRAVLRLRRHLRELPQRRQHLLPERRLVGRATTAGRRLRRRRSGRARARAARRRHPRRRARVPVADELVPGLLTLSDVMGTGHHAAVSAGVGAG